MATFGAVFAPALTPTLPRWYFLMQFVASRLCSVSRHFVLHTALAGMQNAEICSRGLTAGGQGSAVLTLGPLKKAKQ